MLECWCHFMPPEEMVMWAMSQYKRKNFTYQVMIFSSSSFILLSNSVIFFSIIQLLGFFALARALSLVKTCPVEGVTLCRKLISLEQQKPLSLTQLFWMKTSSLLSFLSIDFFSCNINPFFPFCLMKIAFRWHAFKNVNLNNTFSCFVTTFHKITTEIWATCLYISGTNERLLLFNFVKKSLPESS